MSQRTRTFCLSLIITALFAPSASAIGFGAGIEAGGFAGASRLTTTPTPGLYGGGGALLLSLELYDEGLVHLQTLARLEGNGFAVATDAGGGAGGAGGGELLFRLGLNLPIVEPFFELGGGAAVGGGGGTADLSGVGQAVDQAVGGTMWAPGGYVGVGLTMALPLLPYLELRLGSHVGGLLPLEEPAPIPLSGIDALSARGEVWIGAGYRI